MTASTRQMFPMARIVALALIAVVTAGLVYVGLASRAERISPPPGAAAGDLTLEPCSYDTESGPVAADCGTLVIPENPTEPEARLIALPVTRIHARSEQPGEPIFWLDGGPGGTNMELKQANRLTDKHDLVLVGYRGIDGSVRLDCPEVEAALGGSDDLLGEEFLRAYAEAFGRCADRLTNEGVDLTQYGLVQQVDDMEAARAALGYDRIDLLSQSAGTRTAMIYAWRYPDSIHRSVMIAVNPPGHLLYDVHMTDELMERLSAYCTKDVACRARTDDLAAAIRQTAADMPDRWGLLPVKGGIVRASSFVGMTQPDSALPPGRDATLEAWLTAAAGDQGGFWLISLLGETIYPKFFVWGQYAAAASLDTVAAWEYFASTDRDYSNLGYAASASSWGEGRWLDLWPVAAEKDEYRQVRTSEVQTLLINGELDMATPPQAATTQLLPSLPNGQEVVLTGFGHSPTFWADQPEAGTRLITTFLDSSRVDDSLYEPQPVNFTPSTTLGWTAKSVLGVMVAVAVLTIGSLVWMARRTRKGGIGPRASAALRSVYPIVLGLGGWFLAILSFQVARMNVPLDSEPLVVLAAGSPIGLGVFLAWTSRTRSAKTTQTGFAVAVPGALVGAWLGFNASTAPFVGIGFAIVGSIAAANLALIFLDIATVPSTGSIPSKLRGPADHSGSAKRISTNRSPK